MPSNDPIPKEKLLVSWHDTELWAANIVDHMILEGAKPDAILAVGKGGLIPAAMISYRFSDKTGRTPLMDCAYAHSYYKQIRGEITTAGIYEAQRRLGDLRRHGQVMIVDDITDSGTTLDHFRRFFRCALTSVFIHKQTSTVVPDFCGHVDKAGDRYWYEFPWERRQV